VPFAPVQTIAAQLLSCGFALRHWTAGQPALCLTFKFNEPRHPMQKPTKPAPEPQPEYISGCRICHTLNDGICMAACLMDKAQRAALVKQHAHLFKPAR
tara:strand:+ start:4994 stop:5290 length:297 start_codon:yes stop_codon:yes gene_type:complete